jgi:predicted transcriptional regulator
MRSCIKVKGMNAQNRIPELNGMGWSDNRIAKACRCAQPTISRIRLGISDPRESLVRAIDQLYQQQLSTPATSRPEVD